MAHGPTAPLPPVNRQTPVKTLPSLILRTWSVITVLRGGLPRELNLLAVLGAFIGSHPWDLIRGLC